MVSIHAPTRGATKIRLRAALRLVVSIHAPARGATEREVLFLTSGKFQSTPPRGGRPNSLQRVCALTWCFNPRPHAGGDYSALGSMSDNGVSIHAPTRGATIYRIKNNIELRVSIHAPTRGATPRLFLGTSFDVFQSTPPRGGRQDGNFHQNLCQGFNPRPHAGGDQKAYPRFLIVMFQSTPPRGGRPIYDNVDLGDYVFQSTPPRGGRLVFLESPGTSKEVSIHAPTRGATRNRRKRIFQGCVSIHAPTRGATVFRVFLASMMWFQSTPPRGGRRKNLFGTFQC